MRVLILSPYRKHKNFCKWVSSRQVLWGLEQEGIQWQRYHPRWIEPDMSRFDAVLCWSYSHRRHNFPFYARRFEAWCREQGVPIVNSVDACDVRHSFALRKWREAGIPCARHRKFTVFDPDSVTYPVILRRDGVHKGRCMFVAHTPEEAREIVDRQFADFQENWPRRRTRRPLDLAIEFVDARHPDGFHRKRRVYVVGETVIPRQQSLCRDWIVNLTSCEVSPQAIEEDRRFRAEGEPNEELMIRAARAVGSEVAALDYSLLADGSYVFWEVNRHFMMVGDPRLKTTKLDQATGRSLEERREDDEALGRAVGRLVRERIEGARSA